MAPEGYAEGSEVSLKLDKILEILTRIEERQIKTIDLLSEIKERVPIIGNFGSNDPGKR